MLEYVWTLLARCHRRHAALALRRAACGHAAAAAVASHASIHPSTIIHACIRQRRSTANGRRRLPSPLPTAPPPMPPSPARRQALPRSGHPRRVPSPHPGCNPRRPAALCAQVTAPACPPASPLTRLPAGSTAPPRRQCLHFVVQVSPRARLSVADCWRMSVRPSVYPPARLHGGLLACRQPQRCSLLCSPLPPIPIYLP